MTAPRKLPIQVFDPKQEFDAIARKLPHWSQAGTITFITWRTWDSIPADVYECWVAEGRAWLTGHGINPHASDWETRLCRLGTELEKEYRSLVSDRWHAALDGCHGAGVLKRPELAQAVADSLAKCDGDRYQLTDYVVMPNHVHILVAFPNEEAMLAQCDSWKHFTATKINRAVGRSGRIWQTEAFDHLVRTVEQSEYLRRYIAENPQRAKLKAGEYMLWQSSRLTP